MNPHHRLRGPDALIERNLDRACELLALRMIAEGTDEEINKFAENLHRRLDDSIDRTMQAIDIKLKINESLKNPKVANL